MDFHLSAIFFHSFQRIKVAFVWVSAEVQVRTNYLDFCAFCHNGFQLVYSSLVKITHNIQLNLSKAALQYTVENKVNSGDESSLCGRTLDKFRTQIIAAHLQCIYATNTFEN